MTELSPNSASLTNPALASPQNELYYMKMKKERNRNIGFSISLEQNERQMLPLSKQYWIYSNPTTIGTDTAQISFKL